MLSYPCTNEVYEQRMRAALAEAKEAGVTHMSFGDLAATEGSPAHLP
jgi:hypothetical protein